MGKVVKIAIPILLTIAILFCMGWYLFVYDREFTRDVLISGARYFEELGNHSISTWLYNAAYQQSDNRDEVAIELASQYAKSGNYTKAEYTLITAIADGAGAKVYVALSKTFVEQDKLLDAVQMLEWVGNPQVKAELDSMRPQAPATSLEPGLYNDYLQVELQSADSQIYYCINGDYPSVRQPHYSAPITLTDGVNDIQAIAVSENGLVSPIAHYSYTVGGIISRVSFADAAMEAQIRSILGVGEMTHIYTNDLWNITEFTVPENAENYADLSLLPYLQSLTIENGLASELHYVAQMTNLKKLTITNTDVETELLENIASFPALEKLTLDGCNLTSINELQTAGHLTYLDLSNNTLRNISVLSRLPALQEVYLSYNALTDVSSLSVLRNLVKLDVSFNMITSLAPLQDVVSLQEVIAHHNEINDISGMGNLTALTELSLANNAITDVTMLRSCTALITLDISNNQITDITSFDSLQCLTYFNFSHNQVTALPAWDRDSALVSIDGSNNALTSLAELRGLNSLNDINMDYNVGITSVEELAECPLLVLVNVYGTSVQDVSALKELSIIVNYDPTVGE